MNAWPYLRLLISPLVLLAVACETRIETRGHVPDPQTLAKIKLDGMSRDKVIELLGSPSNIATFNNEIWYYITRRTETTTFYEPKTIDQKIIIVAFDETGLVTQVNEYGFDVLRSIDPVTRVTPTAGKKLGFLEQIIGNVGRFRQKDQVQ